METLFTKRHGKQSLRPETNPRFASMKLFTAVLLLFLGASKTYAQAPNISYTSPQVLNIGQAVSLSPVNTGGPVAPPAIITLAGTYNDPRGIAVDASGNVYIADVNNTVIEELVSGGGTPIALGSGFNHPSGVAVDASGNVYVVDQTNKLVKKIPVGNGTVVTVASGFGVPYGIALDGSGYMYVTDMTNNTVDKIPVGGGTAVTLGTGFHTPTGITLDAAGNIFVTDRGNNAIKKILASNGSTVTLGSGHGNPNGVAVDAAGNVFFADGVVTSITEIPAGGGSQIAIASGLSSSNCVTLDNSSNIFMGDSGNHLVKKLSLAPYGYSVSPALPGGLVINKNTGVINGTPAVKSTSTNYTVTALNSSGSGTATVNITVNAITTAPAISYSSPKRYFVSTPIDPLAPTNTGGAVPAQNMITLASSLNGGGVGLGVAVDAAGNIYIADPNVANITKMPADGSGQTTLGSGITEPNAVTVDASGNLYVVDANNKTVKIVKASDGTTSTLVSGLTAPRGIALDGNGYMYVACGGSVKKIPVTGGSGVVLAAVNGQGISVDASGNVYVAAFSYVAKILTNGTVDTLAKGVLGHSNIIGVTVDNNGNVFYTDYINTTITELPATGGTPLSIGSGFSNAVLVTHDNSGQLYEVANGVLKRILITGYSVLPALPAGLSFDVGTGIISGTPTAASAATDYTVSAVNGVGVSRATVNLTIKPDSAPKISYPGPQTYHTGTAISSLSPTNAGGGVPSSSPVALPGTFSNPTGVAVDASGNVYVADNNNNAVKEITTAGSIVVLGSGFAHPSGVAVDASGNVYVVDQGNKLIKKIPAGNGTVVTIATISGTPYGIALDGGGFMYVTDMTNSKVEKIPVGGGTAVAIGTGFNTPTGVAVDVSGNVFVADRVNNAIKEILASDGSTVTLVTANGSPNGVAVDAAGNVYFADGNFTYLVKIRADKQGLVLYGNGTLDASAVALDSTGDIFIANAPPSGTNNIKEIFYGGYTISPSLPVGLTLNGSTGVISGTAVSPRAATNYSVTATNPYGSSTATVNITVAAGTLPTISYPGPDVYPQSVAITPLSPTTSGAGTFGSLTTNVVASGLSSTGVAPDAAGNIYLVNFDEVIEIPANGGARIVLGSGFKHPTGVAVDATGNVFVADYGNNAVKKIPAGNGTVVTLASGLNEPYAIAVDASGNLYFSDYLNNQVKKIPAGGSTPVVIGTGFSKPMGVAVDGSGNVYVADNGHNAIKRIVAGTGATVVLTSSGTPPIAVAADKVGNVYYTNGYTYALEYNVSTHAVTRFDDEGNNTLTGIAVGVADLAVVYTLKAFGYSGDELIQVNPTGGFSINTILPAGLSFSTSTGTISGTPTYVSAAKNYAVSTYNAAGNATTNVNIAIVNVHKLLTSLRLSAGTLNPAFSSGTINYTAAVGNGLSSLTVTPATNATGATIKVNGTSVTSGTASGPIALSVGTNTISTVVTASDGVTTQTYTVVVTRAPSTNANLTSIGPSVTPLSPTFTAANTSYTLSVPYSTATMTVKPMTSDANATMTVNGTTLASGTTSAPIALAEGTTTAINIAVTAQDGTTTRTYTLTVTRGPSTNASLASMNPSITPLSPTFTPATTSYTLSVANSKTSMTVRPISSDVNATITVNGTANPSGTTSAPIALAVGSNAINVVVTAQDGTTTRTYTITVTRAAGPIANFDDAISVTKPTETLALAEDGIVVHQGISPNGDGLNDFFQIDNINQYPDNKLTIMNRSGQMIYEAKNYDNSTKAFDGHSNKNGQMQLPGTYFYQLEYTVKGIVKHRTGFIVLKY